MRKPITPIQGKQLSLEPLLYLPVPELDPPGEIAPVHGVELYWVKHHDFWYFRYWYKEGGRVRRRHIPGGNSSSGTALQRKGLVQDAIDRGDPPVEILKLIASFGRKGRG